ncbi:hypothetical protein CC80DRAFT_592881 [Byssothecium circinans]|uniref:JmjC domain-containing protein n=1 Tax=Byssothecium circinans TaxID=147558 RepID=A0A6A5TYZ1_9PLEO|nr:hypothetical protein CC80DRAFT_592881 [Byssothecium circinans]
MTLGALARKSIAKQQGMHHVSINGFPMPTFNLDPRTGLLGARFHALQVRNCEDSILSVPSDGLAPKGIAVIHPVQIISPNNGLAPNNDVDLLAVFDAPGGSDIKQQALCVEGASDLLSASYEAVFKFDTHNGSIHSGKASHISICLTEGYHVPMAMRATYCGWVSVEILVGESKLRERFPAMQACSQAAGHLGILLTPSLPDSWRIRYHIKLCRPGDRVVVIPSVLHQAVSLGNNIAEPTNFAVPDTSIFSLGYVFCDIARCNPPGAISLSSHQHSTKVVIRVGAADPYGQPVTAHSGSQIGQKASRQGF